MSVMIMAVESYLEVSPVTQRLKIHKFVLPKLEVFLSAHFKKN